MAEKNGGSGGVLRLRNLAMIENTAAPRIRRGASGASGSKSW
jgi:hypothetical protein